MKLVAWGRAVKARTRARRPVLWLFTDAGRGADPVMAAARLPKGLCGVVFRHDGVANRVALAARVARVCRARRLGMVVAGDSRLAAALGVGIHLRGGRWPGVGRPARRIGGFMTSSAHSVPELRRARQAGVDVVFLSPAFATASHPGAAALGPNRWAQQAAVGAESRCKMGVFGLGGMDGASVRRLSRRICGGAGAIGALGG